MGQLEKQKSLRKLFTATRQSKHWYPVLLCKNWEFPFIASKFIALLNGTEMMSHSKRYAMAITEKQEKCACFNKC